MLEQIAQGKTAPQTQDDSKATYANKLDKHEAALDFTAPAITLARKIRAFTSALPCYALHNHALHNEQRIKIISADVYADQPGDAKVGESTPGEILALDKSSMLIACGEGALRVRELQLPGGKTMGLAALLNGRPDLFRVGERFANGL
ncbi:MAG: hypothetical protein HKO07_06815 [Pseudomonadales bacterium]|nr:hypothetical protein [Pseudomonadales bacterium]